MGIGWRISVIFPKPGTAVVNTRADTRTVPDIANAHGRLPIGSISAVRRRPFERQLPRSAASFYLLIGTSASAPELADCWRCKKQRLGSRLGNANGDIYLLNALGGSSIYRHPQATTANRDASRLRLRARNGTPHAADFALDPFGPLAGNPQTPSNP